jgi:hypothetical protein
VDKSDPLHYMASGGYALLHIVHTPYYDDDIFSGGEGSSNQEA